MRISPDIKALLDEAYDRYNTPAFIEEDPVSIPHQFSQKEDIEVAAFFSALIAWGRRPSIIQSALRLMDLMDRAPYAFVREATETDLARLQGFVHRTFNAEDATGLVLALRRVYQQEGGLEQVFSRAVNAAAADVMPGILDARQSLLDCPGLALRTHKHLANPAKGSSAKRINMFLRWMVRRDRRGVDFGLWQGIRMDQLLCPLDVHTATVARRLGLLQRKQNDWKAVIELTDVLRRLCPEDPVRYDFALFGLGVHSAL